MRFLALNVVLAACCAAQAPVTPESKAYSAASALKEPKERLAAFEQFLAEFPAARTAGNARLQVVNSALKVHAADKKKLLAAIDAAAATARGARQAEFYVMTASLLLQAAGYPAEAKAYAEKALKSADRKQFAAEEKDAAERAKLPVPDPKTLKQRFEASRAGAYDTLGQIELKAGRLSAADKWLEKALDASPTLSSAALGRARIAEMRRSLDKAAAFAAHGYLAKPSRESRARFEELYRKTHSGSLATAGDYLDARWRALFPLPFKVTRYKAPAGRGGRVFFAEVHTGAGCGPCAAADVAFDAAMERYSTEELVAVMFHQHIPRPDPLTNADTQARWKSIAGRGVPTYILNGKSDGGGGNRSAAQGIFEQRIGPAIEKGLQEPPAAQLTLAAVQTGKIVQVSAEAGAIAKPSANLKLHFLLLEKQVTYSGENGIRFHPNVVRRMATQPLSGAGKLEQTFDVAEAAEKAQEHSDAFEKHDDRHNPNGDFRFLQRRDAIDAGNLAVAAFIEDEKTREVYQAAWFDLAPARGRGAK